MRARIALLVLASCLLAFACGGKNNNPISQGPTPNNPGPDPTPDPVPDPVPVNYWPVIEFPADHYPRGVAVAGDRVVVVGVRTEPGSSNAVSAFAFGFSKETGERVWGNVIPDAKITGYERGLGAYGNIIYFPWGQVEQLAVPGKVFVSSYTDAGSRVSPWPVKLHDGAYQIDLAVTEGWIFVATLQEVTSLTPDGSRLWTNNFGLSHIYEGISSVATDGADLFVSGFTMRGLYRQNAGDADVFLMRRNPNGDKVWGIQWGDKTHNTTSPGLAVSDHGVHVAIMTGAVFGESGTTVRVITFPTSGPDNADPLWMSTDLDNGGAYGARAMAAEGNDIYVLLMHGLQRVDASSGAIGWKVSDITMDNAEMGDIAIDATYLYVVNGQKLYRVSRSGAVS